MTSSTAEVSRQPLCPLAAAEPQVDPQRWPDVASVPRSRIRAAVAARLMNRVARRLPINVTYPDGSHIGDLDTPTLRLHRPDVFYRRLGTGGLIGFGESYQAGDWSSDDLPALLTVLATQITTLVPPRLQRLRSLYVSPQPRALRNTLTGARDNIHRHYDLSNELFALFLDETLTYSSAIFPTDETGRLTASAENLGDAQRRKIDHLLDLTAVKAGSRVLEIGTGWGELAIRAAQRGATVRSITLSGQQLELAQQRAAEAGVADRVCIELRDYRALGDEQYDAICSVEMIEAVGEQYWPAYFEVLDRALAPQGRVGVQAITMPHDRMTASLNTYTWIDKYVFPGGVAPSWLAIERTLHECTALRVTQRHSFGQHYAATLRIWRERFMQQADAVHALGFDETFRRTWELYLAWAQAGFASGYLDVHQFLLSRPGSAQG